ncbi:hypothetical protein L873DRAFT_1700033 [Choiromyces venosus 120613-1]|uniref:Uncharacterized protein n=1 Tax=Choiromyces venosus 120613-1 TaxID=1336337 RepID=A0A3N4JC72_9PEZI|nr:hypothetical protein L873DRAFT_1700033 [Choiromyces venosus 120613-1]
MGCTKKHTLTISQFRCLGLDLTTNPPKSTVAEVYNKKRFRKVPVTYWKFDIEALCIAQFGASLAHLQRRKAEAKIAMEAAKKANPSPLRRLRDQARARIGDAAWEIYDSKYAWEKICWCSGVTKEQVLAWLYLRPEDEVPVNANSAGDLNRFLRDIRGKETFAQKGEEWYRSVAEQLLDNMTEVLLPENGYRKLAREYHVKRIASIRGDLAGEIPADYICTHQSEHDDKAPFSCRSLMQFLKHMEVEHPGVYWGEDVWVGIPGSVAQEYWDDWSGW